MIAQAHDVIDGVEQTRLGGKRNPNARRQLCIAAQDVDVLLGKAAQHAGERVRIALFADESQSGECIHAAGHRAGFRRGFESECSSAGAYVKVGVRRRLEGDRVAEDTLRSTLSCVVGGTSRGRASSGPGKRATLPEPATVTRGGRASSGRSSRCRAVHSPSPLPRAGGRILGGGLGALKMLVQPGQDAQDTKPC